MSVSDTNHPKVPGGRYFEPISPPIQSILNTLKPFVRQTGDNWRQKWALLDRKLLDYLLVFIAEGDGHFKVGEKSFGVTKNDLIWIPPDTIHDMRGLSQQMRCIYIHFDLIYDQNRSHWDACIPSGVADLSAVSAAMHSKNYIPIFSHLQGKITLPNAPRIMHLMRTIVCEHQRGGNNFCLLLSGLMMELLFEIMHGLLMIRSEKKGLHRRDMETAKDLIINDVSGALNITELATRFHLSPSHFRKLYRETHGQSPRITHRVARIQKACEQLIYTNRSVSQIAFDLGFSTVHNFSRAFREVVGISPTQYKRGA